MDVATIDGSAITRIGNGNSPTWSPAGDLIAHRSYAGPLHVAAVRPDGSGARRITHVLGGGFAFNFPSWSPDGQLITFYAAVDGGHDIWVARSDGTEEWPLSQHPPDEYWPTFSPDGSRIVFGSNVGSGCCQWQLVVMDPDGSARMTLDTETLGAILPSVWSPDGTSLLSRPVGPDRYPLLILDPDGVRPIREIEFDATWANFSWQRLAQPTGSL
jgi:Tol biopolymer transport system component